VGSLTEDTEVCKNPYIEVPKSLTKTIKETVENTNIKKIFHFAE